MFEKYYIQNPNRFSSAKMFCEEHNMAFDVRCSGCFEKFGTDPDVTYFVYRDEFGRKHCNEFSLVYGVNHR